MPLALVIGTDRLNRTLMRDILEIRFSVLEAVSADETLAHLHRSHPQIIILDLDQPRPVGLGLLRCLKARPPLSHTPIIGISADALPHHVEEGLRAGCTEYVTKPITEDPYQFAERLLSLTLPFSLN